MGQAKKKIMRRKAAQAYQHLMRAIECLLFLQDIFIEHHPDYAELFNVICTGINVFMEQLEKTFTRAWGYFPDDLNKWLK